MPTAFPNDEQRRSHGRYAGEPTKGQLARLFHLNGEDPRLVAVRSGDDDRLGFVLQLATLGVGRATHDRLTIAEGRREQAVQLVQV